MGECAKLCIGLSPPPPHALRHIYQRNLEHIVGRGPDVREASGRGLDWKSRVLNVGSMADSDGKRRSQAVIKEGGGRWCAGRNGPVSTPSPFPSSSPNPILPLCHRPPIYLRKPQRVHSVAAAHLPLRVVLLDQPLRHRRHVAGDRDPIKVSDHQVAARLRRECDGESAKRVCLAGEGQR